MKKLLVFNILAGTLFLFLRTPVSGQWNSLNLSGPQAKIRSSGPALFSLHVTTDFPIGPGSSAPVDLPAVQTAASSPGLHEQLFEKLGGEFFVGPVSGQQGAVLTLTGRASPMPGIQLGFRISRRFECQAGVRHFRSQWSGEFPVSVLPVDHSKPKTEKGMANTSASGLSAEAGGAFFITTGNVRPMIRGGVRALVNIQSESEISIGGIPVPVDWKTARSSVSLYAGAGIRLNLGKHLLLEALLSWAELPGGDHSVVPGLGFGWRF